MYLEQLFLAYELMINFKISIRDAEAIRFQILQFIIYLAKKLCINVNLEKAILAQWTNAKFVVLQQVQVPNAS